MTAWLPAYLIHGDDHDRVAERRSRMKASAEVEVGAEGVEHLEGDAAGPAAIANTLSAMTLGLGRRFVLVDGVERWKDDEVEAVLIPVLRTLDGATTTVAFVAMEDKKLAAPASLAGAVEKLGGARVQEAALKAAQLPRWVKERASQLGFELDGAGAQALVDAITTGDRATAVAAYLALRAQGEALPRLTGLIQSRMRQALELARRIEAGEDRSAIQRSVRMAPYQFDRRYSEARNAGAATLATAVDRIARLELAARGDSTLDPDTEAIRVIGAVTGRR